MLAESMRSLPVAAAASVRLWAMLIVIAVPCLVHLPEFAGLISCNPLYLTSGLGIEPLHHGAGGSCVIDGNVGGTLQALGGLSASQWRMAFWPWWNPYAGAGLPLASEMQPASFFLPFVLLLHFTEGVLYLKLSMQVIAGLCALACFREIGASWFAAALGGVFFALNGSFAFFGDAPVLPIAFLPLLVFGIERSRALAQSARPGGQVAVALGIAYSLVAGFPEVAFIDGLLALVWCAIRLVQIEPDSRWRFGGKVVLGGMIGLALATPAMVPFLDDLALSSIGPHGFVPLNHLDLTQLCVLLMPAIYGPPYRDWALSHWTDTGGYLGSALSLMAVFGVFGRRLVGIRLVCAGWILFWLAVFLGEPVTHCLWRITPPLNQVQVTRYAMPSIEFAACVLLVLGVDRWRAARRPKLAWLAGASLSVGTIIAVYPGI